MKYDLFDLTTMDAVDWYDSLAEALTSVRETIRECGVDAVRTWALIPEDVDEQPIRGEELVARATEGLSV